MHDGGIFMRPLIASLTFNSLAAIFLAATCLAQAPPPSVGAQPATNGGNSGSQQTTPQSGAPQPVSPDQSAAPNQPAPDDAAPPKPANEDQSSMFVFKRQVEEVVLHATVVDDQQHMVTGLSKGDFSIYENGTLQPITSFRREDVPVEIGIVVDNSGSMRDKRGQVNQAVLNLIRASNNQDQVFVVNFGRNPYLDQDFTSDTNLLQAALHQVSARGSTALYDAIVASAVHLENNQQLAKKVLLIITDGQDNMSRATIEEASRRLQQENGPTLYAIGLLGNGLKASGRDALQRLAASTGGVAYFPESLDQVDNITRTVAHDIRSQYTLAFSPHNQNSKPELRSLKVEAHAPGMGPLTVRTRSGYYPPSANR
jgi:VWFA-related protein